LLYIYVHQWLQEKLKPLSLVWKYLITVAELSLFKVFIENVGNTGSCKSLVSAFVKQRTLLSTGIKKTILSHIAFKKGSSFSQDWNNSFAGSLAAHFFDFVGAYKRPGISLSAAACTKALGAKTVNC
jgi:hypothetical protein